jgi:uncharacterized membrane protein YtjA (UPF0391 family)
VLTPLINGAIIGGDVWSSSKPPDFAIHCRGSCCEPAKRLAVPYGTFRLPDIFSRGSQPRRARRGVSEYARKVMLNLVVTLLIVALVAAVLGFGGIAMAAVGIAKIVFFVALLLFVIALVAGTIRTA